MGLYGAAAQLWTPGSDTVPPSGRHARHFRRLLRFTGQGPCSDMWPSGPLRGLRLEPGQWGLARGSRGRAPEAPSSRSTTCHGRRVQGEQNRVFPLLPSSVGPRLPPPSRAVPAARDPALSRLRPAILCSVPALGFGCSLLMVRLRFFTCDSSPPEVTPSSQGADHGACTSAPLLLVTLLLIT